MSKIALVRKNGRVDVYERHEDLYWGRAWYVPVPDVETIQPVPLPQGMPILRSLFTFSVVAVLLLLALW